MVSDMKRFSHQPHQYLYPHFHRHRQIGAVRTVSKRAVIAVGIALIFSISAILILRANSRPFSQININSVLWESVHPKGWKPSCVPRSDWPPPPVESNGYLRVRCNGGLNQQRTAICNAVLVARVMNATLVLPELDANAFWRDDSGFQGIYNVDHFVKSLRYDVRVVEKIPEIHKNGKSKKIKAYQLRPPRDAPISWYTTVAYEKMREHSAIYLTPFSHRLAEELDIPEFQRLRCRVNYHALQFKPHIMQLSSSIVAKLRSEGQFMAIHLRFEMDMLAFAGCFDVFTPEEREILKKYRKENFADKKLIYSERRAMGKCPLTPEEVGHVLGALGFKNSTRIYLAAGEIFGGERYMRPLRSKFPRLHNHTNVMSSGEGAGAGAGASQQGLVGSAVDYMVCLLSDIFMPTYDGPSNFANNLLGHRLYYGFRTTLRPDRKALAPVLARWEKAGGGGGPHPPDFEEGVRRAVLGDAADLGGPHKRVRPESFYTNSWPECFCRASPERPADACPPENAMDVLDQRLGV